MRLLIAGHHGQVAQALLAAAGARGWEGIALGRPELDLTLPGTLRAALRAGPFDLVINAAAYTAVDQAESDEKTAFAINAEGAGWLAEAAAEQGVPIIHFSTDYVFDGASGAPYTEDDPVAPLGVYGRSKLAGEHAVAAANAAHVILRTAWVYSAVGHNFLKTMLRLAATQTTLRVVDDQIGSPTYAPHLADAVLDVAAALSTGRRDCYGTFHATASGHASWWAFAREIFARFSELGGNAPEVEAIASDAYPTPAPRPRNSRLNCERLSRLLDVRLPPWQSGVEACLAHMERSGELITSAGDRA